MDCPNLEFEYGDADGHGAELAGEAAFGGCVAINRCPSGWGKKAESLRQSGERDGGWISGGIILAVIEQEGFINREPLAPRGRAKGTRGGTGVTPCSE